MYSTYMTNPTPSSAARPVLVTGALGNVGRAVVAELVAAGRAVRAADLDATSVADTFGADVEAVRLDYTDPATWSAFDGVQTMFVVRPPQLSRVQRDMVPSLEAARAAGVDHMVLLSLQGADRNSFVPHAKLEAWLRDSGVGWTFVRPSFFMENLTTTHRRDIAERGDILVPAGDGRTSFVAVHDVARVAAAALADPAAHLHRAWTPTGPEALTYAEVASILTQVLGRPIRYSRPGILRYARHAHGFLGMPWAMVAVTTAIYTVARLGKADGTTDDVRQVTGLDPTGFRDWAQQATGAWQ